MAVLKQALGVPHRYGGEPHVGWLPPGAATPPPTPVRHATLDVTIEDDGGSGYLLVFASREADGPCGDFWFGSLADAEAAAEETFGIEPGRWQDA